MSPRVLPVLLRPFALSVCLVLVAGSVPSALAHAFGGGAVETRFTFPPWMAWAAGAFVVALSFGIVGGFLSKRPRARVAQVAPETALDAYHEAHPGPGWTFARAAGFVVLVALVLNAFRPGSDSVLPQTVVWLVLWGLIPMITYTVGSGWSAVSPFEALRPFAAAVRGGGPPPLRYPDRLSSWPAVVLLLGLIGLEVADVPLANDPAPLALLVLGYVFVTVVGMVLFGEVWLSDAEVFTRTFLWWRAAAPLRWAGLRPRFRSVPETLGVLPVRTSSDVAFTVAVLFGVNYDAFLATGYGASALDHYADFGIPFPHWSLLLTGFLVFLVAWLVAARAMRDVAESLATVRQLATWFAASLLPIAVGYHLAHNLFTLIENAPRFVLAALDPLGFHGWPGAALDLPDNLRFPDGLVGILGLSQVLIILIGHVVAVVVAHHLAFRSFPSRIQAVRSEVPLTLVMVAYTWTGLWLLGAGHTGAGT